jgi:MFS family permease
MKERIQLVAAVVRDPNLRRVELAFLGFKMTESAVWIAILVYAFGRGGAANAGIVAMILLVPAGLVAPFGAFAGDRFRRDRALFYGYLGQAVAIGGVAAALVAGASSTFVYSVATVASASLTFTRPTHAALLPSLCRTAHDLSAANAVTGLAESVGLFAGPFAAGILLTHSSSASVFAVFAAATMLGALLVAGLRLDPDAVQPKEPIVAGDVLRETFAGFRALRHERRARLLILVLSGGTAVVGALDILLVAVAIDLLDKGQGWTGFLNSAFGVGGIAGALLTVILIGRQRLTPSLVWGAILFGAPLVIVGVAPAVATAPLLLAATGAGRSVTYVAGSTLLQRIAPDEVLARVFGILEGLAMFALAIGSISAAVLAQAFGIRTALMCVGAYVPATILFLWVPLLSVDRGAKAPDAQALALLRRLPIFAPLPPPAIERIMAHLIRSEAATGQVIIREGDEGDRFYVIADGDVDVTRQGAHVGDLHAGDYFGEIALLRDVPRTATVTATTPTQLLALDRDPFLEAVTGHPRSRERLAAVVDKRLPSEP